MFSSASVMSFFAQVSVIAMIWYLLSLTLHLNSSNLPSRLLALVYRHFSSLRRLLQQLLVRPCFSSFSQFYLLNVIKSVSPSATRLFSSWTITLHVPFLSRSDLGEWTPFSTLHPWLLLSFLKPSKLQSCLILSWVPVLLVLVWHR